MPAPSLAMYSKIPYGPPSSGRTVTEVPIPFGDWRPAPEGSVRITRGNVPFWGLLFGWRYEWTLPNGSIIQLAETEIRYTEVQAIFSENEYTDISIRVTNNTLPGMYAYGLVRNPVEAQTAVDNAEAEAEAGFGGFLTNPFQAAGVSFASLAIVALVAGAIWFLPKRA